MTTKILCDADFLIGLYLNADSNHDKANLILEQFKSTCEFVVLNLTRYEFATVLSRKLPQANAIEIYKQFQKDFQNEVWFEKKYEEDVLEIYNSFDKKNISFFDCACLYIARVLNCKIASFDSFYPAEILV